MRLEKASQKAIKYACMNFHYAKAIPVNCFGFSVINEKGEWCGCILYALGANKNLPLKYGLKQGQVLELVRVALNGKQKNVSKPLSLSIKLIKKKCPLVQLIVSYADMNHNHFGTIYQATNWYYDGVSSKTKTPFLNGKRIHAKSLLSKYGTDDINKLNQMGINVSYVTDKPKHRYIFPLYNDLKNKVKIASQPYPKQTSA